MVNDLNCAFLELQLMLEITTDHPVQAIETLLPGAGGKAA